MGKRAIVVKLSDEEAAILRMWANSGKTEQRMAVRSKVILLASQGRPLSFISHELGLSVDSCLKWRKRFIRMRFDGLKDSPRSGKPIRITPDQRVNVIRLACEKPSDGSNAWTVRRLAKRVGLGSTTVHRILNEGVIKPHKVDHWCGKYLPSRYPQQLRGQRTCLVLSNSLSST